MESQAALKKRAYTIELVEVKHDERELPKIWTKSQLVTEKTLTSNVDDHTIFFTNQFIF